MLEVRDNENKEWALVISLTEDKAVEMLLEDEKTKWTEAQAHLIVELFKKLSMDLEKPVEFNAEEARIVYSVVTVDKVNEHNSLKNTYENLKRKFKNTVEK